jgi:hypothetical protein
MFWTMANHFDIFDQHRFDIFTSQELMTPGRLNRSNDIKQSLSKTRLSLLFIDTNLIRNFTEKVRQKKKRGTKFL